jgi:hypothetical protein
MNAPTADWANFFVAEVGASAALAGLVVVAISINLSRILSFPQLPVRAAESLLMLVGALLLASLGLVPGQPLAMFGAEVLVIGLVTLLVMLYNQLRPMPPIEGLSPAKKVYARARERRCDLAVCHRRHSAHTRLWRRPLLVSHGRVDFASGWRLERLDSADRDRAVARRLNIGRSERVPAAS